MICVFTVFGYAFYDKCFRSICVGADRGRCSGNRLCRSQKVDGLDLIVDGLNENQ